MRAPHVPDRPQSRRSKRHAYHCQAGRRAAGGRSQRGGAERHRGRLGQRRRRQRFRHADRQRVVPRRARPARGIGFVPSGYHSLAYSNGAATVTYALNAGTAEVTTFSGSAPAPGGIFGFDLKSLKLVDLQSLIFDLGDSQFDGQGSASVGEVPLLDITGSTFGAASGTSETYSGSELTLDPVGAAYLNSALGTSAFVAGTDVGSFTATWTS